MATFQNAGSASLKVRSGGAWLPSTEVTDPYSRPSDWPTLPTLATTDQKFVGLVAVFPTGDNVLALLADTSTGTYTVDWGDGTSSAGVTKNTQVDHTYNYSTLSSSVTSRGYKTAVVSLTPDTGNLTTLDLQRRPSTYTYAVASETGWLDIAIAGSTITTLNIGSTMNTTTTQNMFLNLLEKANVVSSGVTKFDYLFTTLPRLQTAYVNCAAATTAQFMFASCRSLAYAGLMNTGALTAVFGLFSGCSSLTTVPLFDTTAVTDMGSMFYNCRALVSVPLFNTVKVTTMNSMFFGCSKLTTVPLFNTSAVLNMGSMFSGCSLLTSVPTFDTSKVTNMNGMFNACSVLTTIPAFDTSKVTDATSMFQNCYALTSVPTLNTSAVTTANTMFSGCDSLTTIPQLDIAAVTQASSMFQSCRQLSYLPALVTRSAQNGSYIPGVSGCVSLRAAQFIGAKWGFSVANCRFSAAALNDLYSGLADLNAYTINAATWSSGTATYTTTTTHYMAVGQLVTVTGCTPTAFNGSSMVVTAVTANTFSVAKASNPGTYSSGGSIAAVAAQTLTVTNNYGQAASTKSIATNKGWAVSPA